MIMGAIILYSLIPPAFIAMSSLFLEKRASVKKVARRIPIGANQENICGSL
jgi:hypothetical protein